MLRRIVALLVVVGLLVPAGPAAAESGSTPVAQFGTDSVLCDTAGIEQFSDVAAGDYGSAYVLCMRALGLSAGIGGGNYGPDRELNRGQMATFLVRLWRDILGNDCPAGVVTPFTDVAAGSTHAADIDCMFGLEFTAGTSASTYGPRDPLRGSQVSRFLYRAYRRAGVGLCPGSDGPSLDRAVECLTALNVLPGEVEGRSSEAVTRAQMGVYVVGLWHNLSGRGLPPQPPSKPESEPEPVMAPEPEPEPPPLLSEREGFTALASGSAHVCGMREDGSITCWGGNWVGQAEAPGGSYTAVAAGHEHSCAIAADKTVTCWGDNWRGKGDAPSGKYIAISAGGSHTCAIRTDKTVACWGDNTVGQTEVPDRKFTTIDAGHYHSCGIRYNGTISCWGSNDHGQGDAPSGKYIAISAGGSHTCAVRTDKTINCWGGNWAGQSAAPARYVDAIAAGAAHSCGIRIDQTITCWGSIHRAGALPTGEFTALTAGGEHTCGLRANGTVTCWGMKIAAQEVPAAGTEFIMLDNKHQHICAIISDNSINCWGNNTAGQADAPEGEYNRLAAGAFHSCAIHVDGTVNCWGSNHNGQADAPEGEYNRLAAGAFHSCAIHVDGTVNCWGSNHNGRADPPEGEYTAIAAGYDHACAIRIDRTVNCWGSNWAGRADPPEGEYTAIAAGANHSCAIRTDKTINCWGSNQGGGADPPEGEYTAIAAGANHSCAIRTDKTINCWGLALVVDSPVGVQSDVETSAPTSDTCRPPGLPGQLGAGFPLPAETVSAEGTMRVAVLFADFPDRRAIYSTTQEMKLSLPYIEDYLSTASYGSLDVEWVILDEWLRVQYPTDHYLVTSVLEGKVVGSDVIADVIRIADEKMNFTEVDSVMVVLPSYLLGGGIATGGFTTDEGFIRRSVVVNSEPLEPDYPPDDLPNWGDIGAHELLHNLGLADLYPYYQPIDPEPVADMVWAEAAFGLMTLVGFFTAVEEDKRFAFTVEFPDGNRTTAYHYRRLWAQEMLAWSRWQLGWLGSDRVRCMTDDADTVRLSPIAGPGSGIAMVAVPLSETELIVIESRHKIGYDASRETRWPDGARATIPALIHEGVLVYTVDTTLPTGQLPLKVAGDSGNRTVKEYPLLAPGQRITIRGYTITVQSADRLTHTVHISKEAS